MEISRGRDKTEELKFVGENLKYLFDCSDHQEKEFALTAKPTLHVS